MSHEPIIVTVLHPSPFLEVWRMYLSVYDQQLKHKLYLALKDKLRGGSFITNSAQTRLALSPKSVWSS